MPIKITYSFKSGLEADPAAVAQRLRKAAEICQLGDMERAESMYQEVLEEQPNQFEALLALGAIALKTNQPKRAVEFVAKATLRVPRSSNAYNNLGGALLDLAQHAKAIECFSEAISLDPNNAEAFYNLGNALLDLQQYEGALESYDGAIAIRSRFAMAHCNRGIAQSGLGQPEAALASFDEAVEIEPDNAEAHYNRGRLLYAEYRQVDEAIKSYSRAISIKPDYSEAYFNRAVAALLVGDFTKGFADFEWRWKDKGSALASTKRTFRQPLWSGNEDLGGKTILLHSEQGFGDTIQFCRYAKLVAARDATVILEIQRPLVSLLESLEGVARLAEYGGALPDFDYHCPLMSLPLAFRTAPETIPASRRYLTSDPVKVARWRARLGKKSKPRIGLAWSGSAGNQYDAIRSIRLSDLLDALPPGLEIVNIQKEIRDDDRAVLDLRPDVLNFPDAVEDFSQTAAICECLDLVITVDTSLAHLNAALGQETWLLLPYVPDWRWMLDTTRSPWYPTAKLYRQERLREWDTVFERLRRDLVGELDRLRRKEHDI
jgi:tetratricopeptide (TPR) repeat protein